MEEALQFSDVENTEIFNSAVVSADKETSGKFSLHLPGVSNWIVPRYDHINNCLFYRGTVVL